MKVIIKVVLIALITGFALCNCNIGGCHRKICKLQPFITLDTVAFGEFSEMIPQTGIIKVDSSMKSNAVIEVAIDAMYFNRITPGLVAFATINNKDYILKAANVGALQEGRFNAEFEFAEIPPALDPGKSIRLRIQLSKPQQSLLVPIGGFYKDTRGEWIYIVNQHGIAIKRKIVLGCKNGEYFEVLEGLAAGDVVVTSTYQDFMHRDDISIDEIKKMYD